MQSDKVIDSVLKNLPNLEAKITNIVDLLSKRRYLAVIDLAKSDEWTSVDLAAEIDHYPHKLSPKILFERYSVYVDGGREAVDIEKGVVVDTNDENFKCCLFVNTDGNGTIEETDVDCPLFAVDGEPTDLMLRFRVAGHNYTGRPEFILVEK